MHFGAAEELAFSLGKALSFMRLLSPLVAGRGGGGAALRIKHH